LRLDGAPQQPLVGPGKHRPAQPSLSLPFYRDVLQEHQERPCTTPGEMATSATSTYTLEYTLEHCEAYSFDEGKALVLTKVRWYV
jgi:hypothetical protein